MWVVLAFISALCLGFYDICKKISLRDNDVVDVLTVSVLISSVILSVPLCLSRFWPEIMSNTLYYVPRLDGHAHALTFLKACIVLSSWVFGYISLKHLPISVVNPWQATRPMWTLVGALLLFDERLNTWQWVGVLIALGSILAFSFKKPLTYNTQHSTLYIYYICLALAILIGACSGLYDKYMMRHYDHNAVQVYYTFYQVLMMLVVWIVYHRKQVKPFLNPQRSMLRNILPIALISVFLVISDNVYMLALRDPDSLIAVVSTIRRGGAVIGFAYGLLFLKEENPWKKVLSMIGVLAGLVCLALGTLQ